VKSTSAVKEFSRFAHSYDAHNVIQDEVAKELITFLSKNTYDRVIDIGCGSGAVYRYLLEGNVQVSQFIALDSSCEMLEEHATHPSIEKICKDFNTQDGFSFKSDDDSLIISSSALQWSRDLDFTFSNLSKKSTDAYFAIFTSNTFKSMHTNSGATSPIYSANEIEKSIKKFYTASFETKRYKLHFSSVKEMFRYIKKSGVSGGEKQLSYKATKSLIDTYPLDYLEFEVLFVRAKALS
jgi:malonyl-CoA O-methyltransferase